MVTAEVKRYRQLESSRYYPRPDVMWQRLEESSQKEEVLEYLEKWGAPVEVLLHWPERSGAMLSDLGILRHMVAGNIIIYPFYHSQLGPNSYDVTLGAQYLRWSENSEGLPRLNPPRRVAADAFGGDRKFVLPQVPSKPTIDTYNPLDPANVRFVWQHGISWDVLSLENKFGVHFKGVEPRDEVILLYPHEMILAHTAEFIGGVNVVATTIAGKSTAGRNMIEVCSDAYFGNIGFYNRWTLEIRNKSNRRAIPLIVGQPYAQIVFFESQPTARNYGGTYQTVSTLGEMQELWEKDPYSQMLPKMKRLDSPPSLAASGDYGGSKGGE